MFHGKDEPSDDEYIQWWNEFKESNCDSSNEDLKNQIKYEKTQGQIE